MKTSDMRESKFLKQSDVGAGVLLTITSLEQHNVAKEGAEPENKWCVAFAEADKPLVLNSTNMQLCEQIFGSDETDDWIGKQIVLYADPNVSYGGKLVGGIRVRAPKVKKTIKAAPVKMAPPLPPEPGGEMLDESDIPFAWIVPFALPMLGTFGWLLS